MLGRDRAQGRGVQDLQGRRSRLRQGEHRGPRLLQLGEGNESGGARGRVRHRAVGHVGEEGERPFRADDQVGQDVHGPVVVEERVQAVAGGVLARELAADPLRERFVPPYLVAQRGEAAPEVGAVMAEAIVGLRPRRVDEGAVGEDHGQGVQGVIAVLDDPAAHPRRVVVQDAAHHRRIDGRGIRPQARAGRRKQPVHVGAHHPRLDPDPPAPVQHADAAPEGRYLHEQVVGDGLPRERRPRGAEGQVPPVAARVGEDLAHLREVARPHHRFRDQPVDGSVAGAAEPVQGTKEHTLGIENGSKIAHEGGVVRTHDQGCSGAFSPTGTWKR